MYCEQALFFSSANAGGLEKLFDNPAAVLFFLSKRPNGHGWSFLILLLRVAVMGAKFGTKPLKNLHRPMKEVQSV